ncbi:MAG: tetratricopeptide repeat protein [Spirochaetales bacterium]|uniref:Tetratricopeptide repeat protein n=1 Tax=Candidatus Thalassospirochaeta sargassi TaxID=3119039 RepID=A0AAJ1IEB4_9SPIO|nr:tetratricopeptide repeat protein [Spirochaetales bacterium]
MTDKRHELKGKEKFLSQLTSFLEKNKTVLWIILAVIVAAIVIVAVIDSVSDRKANESALRIESVQKDYEEWMRLEEDEKNEKQQELFDKLDSVTDDYPASYAAQRADYLKGGVYFQNEEWTKAAEFFKASAEVNRNSYLAPIALMLSASSYENAGEYHEALDIYIDVYKNYDKIYPDVPRAMLSIGRLNEQLGDKSAAIDAYNNLLDEYPGSGWASFARTKVIQLD